MKLAVYFTPGAVPPAALANKPVLVIDLLRATTTIVTALANGARAVLPAATPSDALQLAQNLERDDVLLAGERQTLPIPGFALGNSPLEMLPERVAGKTLVMATTNGTPALLAAEAGRPVLLASAVNFSAAADAARRALEETGELVIFCAGRQGLFALEDAYAAGRFVQVVLPPGSRRGAEYNDAAIAARDLARRYGARWKTPVSASAAARDLRSKGFRADVLAATEADRFDVVPRFERRHIVANGRG
ncbi:MAG TPA: 2-phosphosulfolactate phosphatase [Gemmatimonadales bacterium]|nr:2-phosphosulfolactate phosphatase [Gemmatimonadales bacterium]